MLDYNYSFLFFLLAVLSSFALSVILVRGLRAHLLAHAIMDHPNARSMHTLPTPRGGGLGVLIVLCAGVSFASPYTSPLGFWLLPALVLLGIVSWLDDKRGLSPLVRLPIHLLAAWIGLLAIDPSPVLFGGTLPVWIEHGIIILAWGWFMNLYNFMDGIDGITGTQSIATALGAILVLLSVDALEPFDLTLAALIIGAAGGFLIYNWHPAKIFLGDVGSVPLGFLTGYLLLKIAALGYVWAALILPLYYLADSGITIVRRALHGEKIWQAHRQHFYQRAAAGRGRHSSVVGWIILANGGLITSAMVSLHEPATGMTLGLLVLALLLRKMHLASLETPSAR